MLNTDIVGYGIYVPRYRILTSEIAKTWGKNSRDVEKSLHITQKAVAGIDEDAVTIAYEASCHALKRAKINHSEIGVCLVGSESHPYAVNPTSTIVGDILGLGNKYLASDLEFACKAGTAGIIVASGLIASNQIKYGLVIGSDKAQSKPHDILEYTAASGAVAIVLGKKQENSIATIIDYSSFSSDTPDFWRRDGIRFPTHSGRFSGEPAYFHHVESAARLLLEKTGYLPSDFDYCIFHMPNGKFPREVSKRLGFSKEQLSPSLTIDEIGNPYSASSLMGLAAVLDKAGPDKLIFMASYGSGAGSDAFVIRTNKGIGEKRKLAPLFEEFSEAKKYISYIDYLKFGKKI